MWHVYKDFVCKILGLGYITKPCRLYEKQKPFLELLNWQKVEFQMKFLNLLFCGRTEPWNQPLLTAFTHFLLEKWILLRAWKLKEKKMKYPKLNVAWNCYSHTKCAPFSSKLEKVCYFALLALFACICHLLSTLKCLSSLGRSFDIFLRINCFQINAICV